MSFFRKRSSKLVCHHVLVSGSHPIMKSGYNQLVDSETSLPAKVGSE